MFLDGDFTLIRTLLAGAALSAGTAFALPVTRTPSGIGLPEVDGTLYEGAWEIVTTGDTDAVSSAGGDFGFTSNTPSAGDGAPLTEIVEPLWVGQAGTDVGFAADPDGTGVVGTSVAASGGILRRPSGGVFHRRRQGRPRTHATKAGRPEPMISRPLLAAALIAATPAAAMPSFELSGGGVSAVRDLDVGGTLYDVDLGDGGCVELFDGCDGNADFLLPTAAQADALLAALDAVFADPTPIGGLL